MGIKDEDQQKLFKLFGFLKAGQKRNKNGVGLGLVISKMIVEQYEGIIGLESEFGVGSNFFFKIKLGAEKQSINGPIKEIYDFNSTELHDYWVDWDKRKEKEDYFALPIEAFVPE